MRLWLSLISKADTAFSRYKAEYPHQVNYISRRHAHLFLKGGAPFVEDLGSVNGTFVSGKRLDEHAVPLQDDDVLAFGGHHFVYKVSLQRVEAPTDPTVTKLSTAARDATQPAAGANVARANAADADKTTFVAAADSFLDIFCVDHALQQDDEINNEEAKQPAEARKDAARPKARSKLMIFLSELVEAFAGSERKGMRRAFRLGVGLVAVLAAIVLALYLGGASERELKDLLARGDYAQAAMLAHWQLARDPGNTHMQALATEAHLKAEVPEWLKLLNAREFERAGAFLAGMKERSRQNADVQPLLEELEWIGNLEQFVQTRGGMEAPIRIYADEDRIASLLKRWDEDTLGRQRALDRIASYVPAFGEPYADALSRLRRLQSDASVYLAAIERLKTGIVTELNRDSPEAIDAMLKEYAEKYPRLGGLDRVRQDLSRYSAIENEVRARNLGALVALLENTRFSTPPFQDKFRNLASSGRLPSADIVKQYQAALKAWREGKAQEAFAGWQKLSAAPWADSVARQLERKKALLDQFTQLQKTRGAKGYDDRLLSFYETLRPDEDVYFIRATDADIQTFKDKALGRAQQMLTRAQVLWRQYRDNGGIEGAQRIESGISDKFRAQARALSEAHWNAQRGMRIVTQLKAGHPAQWSKLDEEIRAETELQRKSLLELSRVLEPKLLKTKLELLGGGSNE